LVTGQKLTKFTQVTLF